MPIVTDHTTGIVSSDERHGIRRRPVHVIQCHLLYERADIEPFAVNQMAAPA